jgi:hypothetical protein
MTREFWAVRRPRWVAAGLAAAVVSLTVWLLRQKSGPDTAAILSLTVSVVSLGVAVRGLWPDPPLSRVARRLAAQVAQERGAARRQALGVAGDFRPASVDYRSPLAAEEPELVRWHSDGGAQSGTLADVAGYYRSLERGRLVVLGEPGSGKTVLATQLVIDLAESLPDGELQPSSRPPVPVWLSLPSLDLGETSSLVSLNAEETAALLDQWMAAQISAVHHVPVSTAARLIQEQWILPVLDGLDEMDTPGSAVPGSRPRAAAVVRALNAGTGRRPVVLVCRRGEYTQLARSSGTITETPVLQAASQIILQPLDVSAICDYLTRRFPGDQPGELADRWQGVRDALQAATTTTGQASELAEALSSPWRLFLATATYQDNQSSPDGLLHLPAGTLSKHLLSRLIPALTQATPRSGGGYYASGEVTTWLCTLAQHLDQTSTRLNWSPTDLQLQRLWPIAGQAKVQRLSVLANVTILCIGFAVPGLLWVHRNGRWYPDIWQSWVGLIMSIVVIVGLASYLATSTDPVLNRLDLQLTSPARRKALVDGLAAGMAGGLGVGLGLGLADGLGLGLTFGLLLGPTIGLALGLTAGFSLADRPTSVMRQNVAFGLAIGLGLAIAGGLAIGLTGGIAAALAGPLAGRLAVGLAIGLAVGLAAGLAVGLAVWVRYVIGCWLARRQGTLPRRVGQFLDWAYQANLLRMSGIVTQFRHRELQAWLLSATQDITAQTRPGYDGASQPVPLLPFMEPPRSTGT